jgi:hypothetical protein
MDSMFLSHDHQSIKSSIQEIVLSLHTYLYNSIKALFQSREINFSSFFLATFSHL